MHREPVLSSAGPGAATPGGTVPALARGKLVASALAGAWRLSPSPLSLSPAALAGIAPLLLGTGAAGLAWWRIQDPALRASPGALKLQQAYRQQTVLAPVRERQLLQAVTLLRTAGTEPVLFKGWVAARLYAQPGLRPYGDIDLCARPEEYAAARAALAGLAGQECPVDLHRGIRRLDDRDLEEVYRRSCVAPLGQTDVKVLGPEDHLRLLCLHLLDHGAWRAIWLCDVAAALESRPADFDWDYFLRGTHRRSDWAACALVLAHQLLGARLDDAPPAVRTKELPRWLAPAVLARWGAGHRHRERLIYHIRRRRGIWETLRQSWPDPITATVGVRGPINGLPRLPFQLAQCLKRSAQIVLQRLRSASR